MLDFKFSLLIKIISSLFFLLSGIVWKKVLVNQSINYHYIFYRVIATLFFLLLIKFYFQYNAIDDYNKIISSPSLYDWIICITICLFSFWGLYFYTKALQNGRLSFIAPLNGIAPVFSFVTSVIIYNEALNVAKYVSLLLFSIGLFLHQKAKLVDFKITKEVIFTLLFSVIWGISFVLFLIPIKKFGVLNFSMILEICVFISCVGLLVFKEKRIIPPKLKNKDLLLCLLMGFLVAGGSLLGNFTLTQLTVSVNILIGLLFELTVIAVGLYFFRERLCRKDWMLIVFASIGTILLLF
jgi:drug/metabolite transporter (DMT)-like permease